MVDFSCTTMPTPVRRRLALGRLGFRWDRVAGAYRRDEEIIGEEALDRMDEDAFHAHLHTWAGEERCMANQVVANMPFGYGPPVGVAGETLALERGRVFTLRGFANDQLLVDRHYVRPLPDHAQVVCCPVCGVDFVEGLSEHQARQHGPKEAA
jgi:hypothetical protein